MRSACTKTKVTTLGSGKLPLITVIAWAEANTFTSILSLDVEKELEIPFDKARLHGACSSSL